MATSLKRADAVVRLSDRVISILGLNPGPFTLTGTQTYLIGTGSKRLLLDTGDGTPEYKELFKEILAEERCTVHDIIISHHHYDHVGGIPDVLDVVGSDVPVHKCVHSESPDHDVPTCVPIEDGQVFSTEGATLRAIATPGHTSDSMSFLLEETKELFTGDCVLGAGSGVFSDLTPFLASLVRLRELAPARLYCGHGPAIGAGEDSSPTAAVDRIEEFYQHRLSRERQILEAIKSHPTGFSATNIAETLYAAEGIPDSLMFAASGVALLHSRKLAEDGVFVVRDGVTALADTTRDTMWITADVSASDGAGAGSGAEEARPKI